MPVHLFGWDGRPLPKRGEGFAPSERPAGELPAPPAGADAVGFPLPADPTLEGE